MYDATYNENSDTEHGKRKYPSSEPSPRKLARTSSASPRPSAIDAGRRISRLYEKGAPLGETQPDTQGWDTQQPAASNIEEVEEVEDIAKQVDAAVGAADFKTPADKELLLKYNRLRSAFQEGEEERQQLTLKNVELEAKLRQALDGEEEREDLERRNNVLEDKCRRVLKRLGMTKRYIYLVGKQLATQGEGFDDDMDPNLII